MSATEACYRLFAFELHANLPHVMRLALDLEGKQTVVFRESSWQTETLNTHWVAQGERKVPQGTYYHIH